MFARSQYLRFNLQLFASDHDLNGRELTRHNGMSLFGNSSTKVYLGLGSNLGDRAGNLLLAVRCLFEAGFCVERLSAIYETEPVEIDTDKRFLNMAVECSVTNITPTQAMARLLRIEYLLGRGDKSVKKPRTVDLDILIFGNEVMETEFLTLPHPRLHERRFALEPLNDIAPKLIHPTLGRSVNDLFSSVFDDHGVEIWDPNQQTKRFDVNNG